MKRSFEATANVSVIIPVYNRDKLLRECLRSIYAQTLKPNEVIVVDDYSDPPVQVPKYPKLKVLRLRSNNGPGAARNRGAEVASQRLLLFLDSDDLLLPRTIQTHVSALDDSQAQGAWCNVLSTRGSEVEGRSPLPESDNQLEAMLRRNFIHSMSGFSILRSTFQEMGGFREDVHICEDLDFYVRLLSKPGIRLIELGLFLVHRRLHGDNLTSDFVDWSRNLVRVHNDLLKNPLLEPYLQDIQYGFERRLRRLMSKSVLSDRESVRKSLELVCRRGKFIDWRGHKKPTEPKPSFIPVYNPERFSGSRGAIILNLDWKSLTRVSPWIYSVLACKIAKWASERELRVCCVPHDVEVGNDDRVPLSLFALSARTPVSVLSRPLKDSGFESVFQKVDAVITTRTEFAKMGKAHGIETILIRPCDDWKTTRSRLNSVAEKPSEAYGN